mmetsp:Transcript_17433/g.25176  ORF Transcript_17433/g.25176 Transcript_17433/m.25176 type:complete len:365 (+) Transcript_17433:46-1140(+)
MSGYYGAGGYGQPAGNNAGDGNQTNPNPYYGSSNYGQPTAQPQQEQQQQQQPGSQQQSQTHNGYGQQQAYANPNMWQQPQQQAAPVGVNGAPNQQQPAFWNPATAATVAAVAGSMAQGGSLNNDAIYGLAEATGKSLFSSGTAKIVPGVESFMIMLRQYFAVDNYYVKRKMQKILVPFFNKQWARQVSNPGAPGMPPQFAPPNIDENAPDLYIPSMALITYVLLCALCYGTAGKFNPEVLPDVCTKCFVTQIIEVLVIRACFYTMQAPVAILDLFSYTGYKYLGLCVNMLAGMASGHFGFGHTAYYLFFLWTASAVAFFMLRTMANNIPTTTASTGPKRELMVFLFAGSQFLTMWFVSQTKFLN